MSPFYLFFIPILDNIYTFVKRLFYFHADSKTIKKARFQTGVFIGAGDGNVNWQPHNLSLINSGPPDGVLSAGYNCIPCHRTGSHPTHHFTKKARFQAGVFIGAGDGNRTHVFSLGSCCTTIVLHPHLTILFYRIDS